MFEFGEGSCKPKDDEREGTRRASATFLRAKAAADGSDRQKAAIMMEAGIRDKAMLAHMVCADVKRLYGYVPALPYASSGAEPKLPRRYSCAMIY